ncbi:hypothetical protein O181_007600 [Austropuccinia psidii MF-1]|uniref:Uncharacterized protein n=1 Tax=Austropuccinia psidii MF-1 TaxID=1389203 RepID=A0A9Q3BMQ5_9BASI|nr:hypothetical protein [Austropuccinia psidii MF-1]
MPTLMHELASAQPTTHLCQCPIYASTPVTAPPQSPILILLHPSHNCHAPSASTPCLPSPHPLPCLCSRSTLKIFLRCRHPPYASTPLPNTLFSLPFLQSHIRSIGYSGFLAYMMNPNTEIC